VGDLVSLLSPFFVFKSNSRRKKLVRVELTVSLVSSVPVEEDGFRGTRRILTSRLPFHLLSLTL